ncbi:MAG: hypothetical protein WCS42_24805 [Verrucomicrobiota bacterium]
MRWLLIEERDAAERSSAASRTSEAASKPSNWRPNLQIILELDSAYGAAVAIVERIVGGIEMRNNLTKRSVKGIGVWRKVTDLLTKRVKYVVSNRINVENRLR